MHSVIVEDLFSEQKNDVKCHHPLKKNENMEKKSSKKQCNLSDKRKMKVDHEKKRKTDIVDHVRHNIFVFK